VPWLCLTGADIVRDGVMANSNPVERKLGLAWRFLEIHK